MKIAIARQIGFPHISFRSVALFSGCPEIMEGLIKSSSPRRRGSSLLI